MTLSKRLFDIFSAFGMLILLSPLMVAVALVVLLVEGRPVFFLSERMKTPTQGFQLIKFRTMADDQGDRGAFGGHMAARITRTGRFLRRYRLDEMPQLINILRGDMSWVGPRPPLRCYVEGYSDLYREVLKSRPGITGLGSIYFHRHEDFLLAQSTNRAETEAIYRRRCIPRKARIDLLYPRHQSVCFDMYLMLASVIRRLR